MEDRGTALIAWDKVTKPKENGGLGVLDLRIHNTCLLMKHMSKFINQKDLPWVKLIWQSYYAQGFDPNRNVGSFWWRNILKFADTFKQIHTCKLGKGNTLSIWHDDWGL